MPRWAVPAALAAALAVTFLVFYLDPAIDLDVAQALYRGDNKFVGQTPSGEIIHKIFYWVPTVVFVANVALYAGKRFGLRLPWTPSGRGVIALALSFALGPGLLVNTVLKDHSHRPRPYQTVNFGGDDAFRPFYTFDGGCVRNCSFVSGEGAASTWTVAPALLVPPAIRVAALGAAVAFAIGASGLRMAFGGHYLSDTIFAALFTLSVVWATWQIVKPISPGGGTAFSRTRHRRDRM